MEQLSAIYETKIKCINCKKEFKSMKVRSKFNQVKDIEKDFRMSYINKENGIEPFLYSIHVCEHCGFSFNDTFNSYFKVGQPEKIKELISSKWVNRSYAHERSLEESLVIFKLALHSALVKEEYNILIAQLCMKISWIYKDLGDEENENVFLKNALNYYKESYSTGDSAHLDFSVEYVCYMIGYLNVKLGYLNESVFYISKVIENQNKIKNKKLLDFTFDLWEEVKDKRRDS